MKSLGDYVADCRDLLAEPKERRWTNEMLRRWVQDGAKDIARKCECIQAWGDIDAVAGTQQYKMPDNIVRVYRLEFTVTGDEQIYTLDYRDFNTMDEVWWTAQSISQARPYMFTMWGMPPNLQLVVYPTPTDAGSFRLFYYRLPTPLANDGSQDEFAVELPEGWDDLAVEYAVMLAWRRDSDPRWQEAKAIYEDHLKDLKEDALRWTDQAGMVTSGTSMVPRWLWDEGYG